jgi:predicted nicotinamide N-methyase
MGSMTQTWEQRSEEVIRRVAGLSDLHLEWRKLNVGGERFELATCSGADVLLNALIEADPNSAAVRDERLPYWTEIWPSALAVASRVMEAGADCRGKRVLDMGCGLGLAGLAAGRCGAQVTLCDYDLRAVRFAALNWVANVGPDPEALVMDWRQPAMGRCFDRILAADVVYEERFFNPVVDAFARLLKPGGQVLLGEPNRPFSAGFFRVLTLRGYRYEHVERIVNYPNPANPTSVGLYTITPA